jgi:hypothetical protein
MKIFLYSISAILLALLSVQPVLAASDIKLSGRKDLVLSHESRIQVLDVVRDHLSAVEDDFLVRIQDVDSPYVFEKPPVVVAADEEEVVEEVVITYDDASVLQVVASNFATQVRGSMGRGETRFLQLKGGKMIKPGTSFPVSIPEAKDQSFILTISEITSDGYILKLGEATKHISLNGVSSGDGAMREF